VSDIAFTRKRAAEERELKERESKFSNFGRFRAVRPPKNRTYYLSIPFQRGCFYLEFPRSATFLASRLQLVEPASCDLAPEKRLEGPSEDYL
jgi:hypothetical protein